MVISFVVDGEPHAQQRARATTVDGKVRMYDPIESVNFKELVGYTALQYRPKELLDGPLTVTLDICRLIPKRFSKKDTQDAIAGRKRPITKPDSSNYLKGVEDALNGVIWKDDSQIVTLIVRKWYGVRPGTFIKIEPCEHEAPPWGADA
jgi:Holliday junction resolvase RusA-like endonuclease